MAARRLCFTLTLLLCTFYRAVAAQESEPPAEAPIVSAKGQVVDFAGKPVEGARVVLREWSSYRYSEDPYQTEVKDVLAETTTDSSGKFQFESVESHPFRAFLGSVPWDVVAMAKGHGLAWVHLKSTDSDEPLTLKLTPAKKISGRLVNEKGQPVADCKVIVAGIDAPGSQWHMDFGAPPHLDLWRSQLTPTTTTDSDGKFEIDGLPADQRLSVIAQHAEFQNESFYVATSDEPQPPVVQPRFGAGPPGEESKSVHMPGFTGSLVSGRQISGRVVFADTEQPAAQTKINLIWQSRAFYDIADAAGRFEFSSLPDPKYYLGAGTEQAGYLDTRVLVEFSNGAMEREIDLKLPRGEPVRGEVVDAESRKGVPGVGVQYIVHEQDEDASWSPSQAATTDQAGRFEILVPSGPGELRVWSERNRHPTHDVPDFWRWRSKKLISPQHTAKINVISGKTLDDIRLEIAKGLVVRGRVVDPEGKPIFAAMVRAPDRFRRPEHERKTASDDEGRFELANFPREEERQIEVIDVESKLRGSATLTVDALSKAGRELQLGDIEMRGTGTVTGTVLGDGKPLAGASVGLVMQVVRDGKEEYLTTNNEQVETDKEGRFKFDSVQAGVRVSVYVSSDGYTNQGTTSYPIAVGQEVELPAITLKSRGAFVSGVVVDLDGKPVKGVTVSASEHGGGASISYGRGGPPPPTDANGRFRINDLPNVPLELMAYVRPPDSSKDRSINFPATVKAEPNQTDVRIVLDPKLQRPLP